MEIAVIYFSGTGVTEGYAEIIARELEHQGANVALHNITSLQKRKKSVIFEQYDALIFGFPVYGGWLPNVAESWLSGLTGTQRVAMYFTYGGRDLEYAHQTGFYLLSQAKFVVILSAEFLGKHSFNVAKGWNLAADRPNDQDVLVAKQFAKECFERFQKESIRWSYDLTNFSYRLRVTKEIDGPFAIFLPSKSQDCRMCYRCENECPTNAFNLTLGQATNGICISCMHCVFICPDEVIEVGDATKLFQHFGTQLKLTHEKVINKKSRIIY